MVRFHIVPLSKMKLTVKCQARHDFVLQKHVQFMTAYMAEPFFVSKAFASKEACSWCILSKDLIVPCKT